MFHPLQGEIQELTDQDLEKRLIDLNRKYHQAARIGNRDLLTQVQQFITIYRDEMSRRHQARFREHDRDLSELINVD